MDKAHACDSTTPRTRTVGFDVSPTPRAATRRRKRARDAEVGRVSRASTDGGGGRGGADARDARERRWVREHGVDSARERGSREGGVHGGGESIAGDDLPVRPVYGRGGVKVGRESERRRREKRRGKREVVGAKDEAVEAIARRWRIRRA